MKGYCALLASALAAAAISYTSGSRDISLNPFTDQGKSGNSRQVSAEKITYAPRFDGLRFIETLVTGHRCFSFLDKQVADLASESRSRRAGRPNKTQFLV